MNQYKVFWHRVAAAIIDGIILSFANFFIKFAVTSIPGIPVLATSIVGAVIYISYFVIGHGVYRQTLGKKVLEIKVVDKDDGSKIGIKRAILRQLPAIIGYVMTFTMVRGYAQLSINADGSFPKFSGVQIALFSAFFVWIISDIISAAVTPRQRALRDYLASSVVTREKNNPIEFNSI